MFTYRSDDPDEKKQELSEIIEQFEVAHDARQDGLGRGKRSGDAAPNIILMRVDRNDGHSDSNKTYIIGGYASHKWKGQANGNGDKSCFLFNLTQNLRFNAREGMPFYQSSDGSYLQFGNTDLRITDSFQTVTSLIQPPTNYDGGPGGDRRVANAENRQGAGSGSHFSFGNDLTQTN